MSMLAMALLVGWAAVTQTPTPADEVVAPNAARVVIDRVAPEPGQLTGPECVNKMPIVFSYAGAGDGDGSGLKAVTLWMKRGTAGNWTETSARGSEASGMLSFDAINTDGRYCFALRAEDNAGNLSAKPQGDGAAAVVLDRRPPVITLIGASTVWVSLGGTYKDAGATASDEVDGDLTSAVTVEDPVDASKPGTYFVMYNATDRAGNAANPVYRTVKIEGGHLLTLEAPAHGSIEANPAPGAGGRYATGTVVTLRYAADPLAAYDATGWLGASADVPGSGLARVVMDSDRTVSVQLARQTGSVTVDVTPDNAQWTVTDGDGAARPGTGDASLAAVPTGPVSIAYSAIEGMTAPARQEGFLLKGGVVSFRGAYSSGGEATVTLPKGLEAVPGDTVDCALQVSTNQPLTAFRLELKVDPAVARVTGAVNGALTSGWAAVTVQPTSGGAVLSGSGPGTAAGGGSLIVVRLEVAAEASDGAVAPLQAVSVSLNNGALPARGEDGELIVHARRFAWGDANGDGSAGDTDASTLLQYRVGLIERLPADADPAAANVSGEEPAVLGTLDAALVLQYGGKLITRFPADADGDGFGPEAVPAAVVPSPAQASRTILFADTVEADRGVEFSVPVGMDDAGGVLGCYVEVAYDPATVEFISVGRGSLIQMWTMPVVYAAPGLVAVASAGAEAASGAGSLFVLNFRTRPDAGSGPVAVPFQLAACELNDGTIPCSSGATGAAPVLDGVTPARGAELGGTVVTLKGANLAQVTEVRFGGQASSWIELSPNRKEIKAVAPAGTGVVDVAATALAGTATLTGTFTYFQPDVYLTLEPQVSVQAGQNVDVPVALHLTEAESVTSVDFELRFDPTLFAVQPGGAVTLASPGSAALAAGKQVVARLEGPGQLSVSIQGTPSKPLREGLLCTCHVLALGDTGDTTGLFYVSGISATDNRNRALPSDSGTAKLP